MSKVMWELEKEIMRLKTKLADLRVKFDEISPNHVQEQIFLNQEIAICLDELLCLEKFHKRMLSEEK